MKPAIASLSLAVGLLVAIGSFNTSRDARLEGCKAAYHNMIDQPQAFDGPIAKEFAETMRKYPGECRPEADNVDTVNALLGGGLVAFFLYLFLLLVGKFCRWAEN